MTMSRDDIYICMKQTFEQLFGTTVLKKNINLCCAQYDIIGSGLISNSAGCIPHQEKDSTSHFMEKGWAWRTNEVIVKDRDALRLAAEQPIEVSRCLRSFIRTHGNMVEYNRPAFRPYEK